MASKRYGASRAAPLSRPCFARPGAEILVLFASSLFHTAVCISTCPAREIAKPIGFFVCDVKFARSLGCKSLQASGGGSLQALSSRSEDLVCRRRWVDFVIAKMMKKKHQPKISGGHTSHLFASQKVIPRGPAGAAGHFRLRKRECFKSDLRLPRGRPCRRLA